MFSILLVHLAQNANYDLALHNAQPTAFDGILQFGLSTVHNTFPVVATPVHFVHAQLGARRVGIAGVLRKDGADKGIEDGRTVAAACRSFGCDDLLGPRAWAVQANENGMRQAGLAGSGMWKGGEG